MRAHGRPRRPGELTGHRCLVYSLASSPTRWTLQRHRRRVRIEIAGPLSVNSSLGLAGAAIYPRHHQVSQRVRLFVDFLAARLAVRAGAAS